MPLDNIPLTGFNRGLISPRALCRVDLKRTAMSAEIMNNWLPHVLGSMMLRPGLGYTTGTQGNNKAITIPFVYSGTDLARLEITNQILRPLINDQPITRVSVGTTIVNSTFAAYLADGSFATAPGPWTAGAGWVLSAGSPAAATTSSANLTQTVPIALINGQTYNITYTITRSAGTVTPTLGGTSGTGRVLTGTYTDTIVAGATQVIGFTGAGFTGTITAISVETVSTAWQDLDETGATSTTSGGFLQFNGTGGSAAIREQQVTVAGGDIGKEQAIRIVVTRGPIMLRIGSASGADDLMGETVLGTGNHSIAITPTGNFFIRLFSYDFPARTVASATIEGAGIVTIPAPWLTADLPSVRWEASADITWVACFGYQTRKIERRSTTSWSVVLYEPPDGPFRLQNGGITTISASATQGDVTLTSSKQLFHATQVGGLFKLSSIGQVVDTTFTAANQFSSPIKVTGGAGGVRDFLVTITGTWVGKVTLQYSVGDIGDWQDVPGEFWTANTAAGANYNDGLINQIIFYRLAMETYTSGSAVTELNFQQGSIDGIVKITGFTSTTSVSAAVLSQLGGTVATALWEEGEWSDYRGWPSEVKLHEGRLFFMGFSKIWGSIPDAYESYDESIIGDSGVINRSYGRGPVDKVIWTASLQRLLVGGEIAEWSVRSDSFDGPLTPSNFTVRSPSTQGGFNCRSVQIDSRCIFIGKAGNTVFEMNMADQGGFLFDYTSQKLSQICPELFLVGISRIAVQRNPDTRLHVVLNDGTVAVLISDPAEDVTAWILFSTPNGTVEDVCVLPGNIEDSVYYTVNRTIQASTVRYHEKFSLQMTECQGGQLNKQSDSFVSYTGTPTGTITAAHLKGQTCVIWGDGKDLGTAVADAGTGVITIPGGITASNIVAGLGYTASFKSSKLAYATQAGSALALKKRIDSLSLIVYNTHYQGLQYSRDGAVWMDMPQVIKGQVIAANTVFPAADMEKFPFPGTWDSDSRLYLQASSPRPCTILGAIMGLVTNG